MQPTNGKNFFKAALFTLATVAIMTVAILFILVWLVLSAIETVALSLAMISRRASDGIIYLLDKLDDYHREFEQFDI